MNDCKCGHSFVLHDHSEGCIQFLCCNKTRILTPGKRHTEHDFANHQVKSCRCMKFDEQPNKWIEDMEAGAIG